MTWAYTKNKRFFFGEEPSREEDLPCDANVLIYEGSPLGFSSGSSPANVVRPCAAADKFAGFALRAADNRSPVQNDILNYPNVGDGTTGTGGAFVRSITEGRIRLLKSDTPDTAGTVGNGVTGAVYTQADQGLVVYYNGSGFTSTSGGNTKVGTVVAIGTTITGASYLDIEFQSDSLRTK